jgi:hypothetical protein
MPRLLAVVAFLFCAFAAAALAPLSSLGGRVLEGTRPLAGVTVTVSAAVLQQPRTTVTDADGRYWVPALAPGVYDVTFSLAKHQTLTLRAELHTGEQTRTDAALEANEEEEAVTSTASRRSLLEEPRTVFSLDGETLNLLPGDRIATALRIDEQRREQPLAVPLDALRELAVPISAPFDEPTILVTRDATNAPAASIRATTDGEHRQTFEAVAGGAAIDDRLWLFGYALMREQATTAHARVTFSPTAHDSLSVFAHDGVGASWLRSGERLTTFATASRDHAAAQAFVFAGGQELAAGGERIGHENRFFVRDRFVWNDRVILEGEVRVEDEDVLPRAGVVYDLAGDGRQRVAAWWQHHNDVSDEAGLAFARQLSGGYARATLLRRNNATELVADAAYHYLLFTFGTLTRLTRQNGDTETSAAAWVLAHPPILEHDVTLALLGRYGSGASALDLAVTYAFTRGRVAPFVKAEGVNLFDGGDERRTWRIGIGARL